MSIPYSLATPMLCLGCNIFVPDKKRANGNNHALRGKRECATPHVRLSRRCYPYASLLNLVITVPVVRESARNHGEE